MARDQSYDGQFALVLHTHMPYVEGFDTWPFGEEWLWEAVATSYLPVLDVLEQTGAPVTVSLTPVLCDQLAAPDAIERCLDFIRDIRPAAHAIDRAELAAELHAPLDHSAAVYARAADELAARPDVLARFAPFASWTSSATHAVLPLLATDAGARLQIQTGVDGHRSRFGDWRGGFWLPECAHSSWLEPLLAEEGARATCVDLSDVLGLGSLANLQPLRGAGDLTLVPLDRQTTDLVWSQDGYPADGGYRDYHHRTRIDHRVWAVDGTPYDPDRGAALAREHAADFVARVLVRLREAREQPGALVVCAIDTELLGHWWHEGPQWLRAVIDECERQGLELVHLDDALERREADGVPAPAAAELALPVTSWGTPRDLTTWSGPAVAGFAWRARAAELALLAAGRGVTPRAARELLALQSSDWAFMVDRELAAPYGHARAEGHHKALLAELATPGSLPAELRSLAPRLSVAPLLG
ncbi:MAG TPA: 1,4-alpha-glucan branching protein domain-containing protein [Solirubrobacteraceae bacterium]|nr:1,4-alpha-glucan branching protein domain-containing protein [Solirubrobacteraceae bacterium]